MAEVDDELPVTKPGSTSRLNILYYGPPKVGKTTLAGTAEDDPRCGRVLFIDFEGGTLSISGRGENLDVYAITSDFDARMNQILGYLHRHARAGDLKYGTVVIDSLSELCDRAMLSVQARPGRKTDSSGNGTDDWTQWTTKMRTLLGMFRDLPVHLIVTALEEEVDGKVQPLFPGKKVSIRLPGYFDTVARLAMKPVTDGNNSKSVRVLQLQPTANVTAGDRADHHSRFPAQIVDPTISQLLDRVDQKVKPVKAGKDS